MGIIYQISIFIPPGCSGLTGVAVFDGNYQIWPTNPDVYFVGDNLYIDFPDSYYKLQPPYQLIIKTYNTDDTYDHSISLHIGLLTYQEYSNRYLPGRSVTEAFIALQKAYEAQQEGTVEEIDWDTFWSQFT